MAFSGGLDSSVLLQLFVRLRQQRDFTLSAVHVHHALSSNADAWAAHCRQICKQYGVTFRLRQVAVSRAARTSLEEEARRVRYAAFAAIPADVIALGHHANDQAETVLTQLLRGAGPKGVAGMPEFRLLNKNASGKLKTVWRPLLMNARQELELYADSARLVSINDESNQDIRFKRNFVRASVLPLLAEGFPAPIGVLTRAARHFAEAGQLADDLADLDIEAARRAAGLDVVVLTQLSEVRLKNALRRWIDTLGVRAPSERRLLALAVAIRQSTNDTKLEWRHEGLVIRRKKGLLFCA